MFPNQDFLSGKGLGNLIALPFQGNALQKGNSCFINNEIFIPFKNQWKFLKEIKRVSTNHLDEILKSLGEEFQKKIASEDSSSKVFNTEN